MYKPMAVNNPGLFILSLLKKTYTNTTTITKNILNNMEAYTPRTNACGLGDCKPLRCNKKPPMLSKKRKRFAHIKNSLSKPRLSKNVLAVSITAFKIKNSNKMGKYAFVFFISFLKWL